MGEPDRGGGAGGLPGPLERHRDLRGFPIVEVSDPLVYAAKVGTAAAAAEAGGGAILFVARRRES
jgi:hypothetical protein